MSILVCEKCNVYYEIDSKEDMLEFKHCDCGNQLEYFKTLDEYLKSKEIKTTYVDVNLLIKQINLYESAISKIILYCVAESKSSLTISRIIKILRGSDTKYQHKGLNSHGTLTNFSRKRLERYIQTLIDQDLLKMFSSSRYKPIILTEKGFEFLSSNKNLNISIYHQNFIKNDLILSTEYNENPFDFPNILLNDPNGTKRAHVAYLLGETRDPKYLDVLCKATKDKDGNVRRLSASALGKIGDQRAENTLIKLLNDQGPQIRQYAAKALGKIGSKISIKYLEKLNTDEKQYVSDAASKAITDIKNKI